VLPWREQKEQLVVARRVVGAGCSGNESDAPVIACDFDPFSAQQTHKPFVADESLKRVRHCEVGLHRPRKANDQPSNVDCSTSLGSVFLTDASERGVQRTPTPNVN
jgi:hypothetical protein